MYGREPLGRLTSAFGLVLALAHPWPSTALAQADAVGGEPEPPVLACSVNGYDVMIFNRGTEAFLPGTVVEWYVPFARKGGTHVLEAGLEPGSREFLTGILANNWLDPGKPCEIVIAEDTADAPQEY
jgi:hypothetical protein